MPLKRMIKQNKILLLLLFSDILHVVYAYSILFSEKETKKQIIYISNFKNHLQEEFFKFFLMK